MATWTLKDKTTRYCSQGVAFCRGTCANIAFLSGTRLIRGFTKDEKKKMKKKNTENTPPEIFSQKQQEIYQNESNLGLAACFVSVCGI